MPKAAIFDVDGTLVDSVDLHASAWQEALQVRPPSNLRTGPQPDWKGRRSADHGEAMEEWRGNSFKSKYLPMVRPFSAVPELLRRVRDTGVTVAVASSAKKSELDIYLEIAGVRHLVNVATSSEDAAQSKPAPRHISGVFEEA